jgi:hypothetical protein
VPRGGTRWPVPHHRTRPDRRDQCPATPRCRGRQRPCPATAPLLPQRRSGRRAVSARPHAKAMGDAPKAEVGGYPGFCSVKSVGCGPICCAKSDRRCVATEVGGGRSRSIAMPDRRDQCAADTLRCRGRQRASPPTVALLPQRPSGRSAGSARLRERRWRMQRRRAPACGLAQAEPGNHVRDFAGRR